MTRGRETIAVAARRVSASCRLLRPRGWEWSSERESPSGLWRVGCKRSYDPTISSYDWILATFLATPFLPPSLPTTGRRGPSPCEFLASVARSTPPRHSFRSSFSFFLSREKRSGKGDEENCVVFCIPPSVPFVLSSRSSFFVWARIDYRHSKCPLWRRCTSYLTYELTYVTTNSAGDEKRRNTRQPNCNAEAIRCRHLETGISQDIIRIAERRLRRCILDFGHARRVSILRSPFFLSHVSSPPPPLAEDRYSTSRLRFSTSGVERKIKQKTVMIPFSGRQSRRFAPSHITGGGGTKERGCLKTRATGSRKFLFTEDLILPCSRAAPHSICINPFLPLFPSLYSRKCHHFVSLRWLSIEYLVSPYARVFQLYVFSDKILRCCRSLWSSNAKYMLDLDFYGLGC